MKAPEKVYLQICGDCNDNDCRNCKFEDLEDNVTWCRDKIFKKDFEYTRTDAFIEKAAQWLKENLLNHTYIYEGEVGIGMAVFLEQFKKAMKGE